MTEVTLKGKPIRLSGNFPQKGTQAPDFVLVDADLHDRTLKDYAGKRKLISIVPSLDTSVCSLTTKKFNEKIQANPGVVALVVSADLPFAQKRMCAAEHVTNLTPLSMMRNREFAKAYGVLMETGPLAGICARAVIVLDEHDKVVYTQLVPEISQEPDYESALKELFRNLSQ